jgi:Mn-dependent DtxR family transcriptional regulator
MHLWQTQLNFEDALRIETTYEEVKETKEGRRLLRYLRKRRRIIERLTDKLAR